MLDIEGLVKDWINSKTETLVGPGKPVERGAHLKRLRSQGSYLYLLTVSTPGDWFAETSVARARVSATAYATTKGAASRAAVAYTTLLEEMRGQPEIVGDYKLLVVDNITGPIPLDDTLTTREEFRYLIDADFYFSTQ